jgi:hypothetical protein
MMSQNSKNRVPSLEFYQFIIIPKDFPIIDNLCVKLAAKSTMNLRLRNGETTLVLLLMAIPV